MEAQVLPMIWSRKPSSGPLLCNLSAVILDSDHFNGLAILPRLIIGPHIRTIKLDYLKDSFSWANLTAILREAVPTDLSSFMLRDVASTLSWSEAESLELLLILRGAKTLDTDYMFLTSRAISLIATFPALEDFKISVTEQEMEGCTPSMVGNSFQTITCLAIRSDSDNACQLMLMKIQSKTCRSLELSRTSDDNWNVGKLFLALHACNMASSLESLHVCNRQWVGYKSFDINAHALKHLHSFEQLRELSVDPSSLDLCDNDLLEFAKALPQLRLLVFFEDYVLNNQPNCTFIGMQHIIQFCPNLQNLALCVDARQIPTFATQPDGAYPIGFHLTILNLRNSPVSNACDVASYLIMLFPALEDFWTAYSDGTMDLEEVDLEEVDLEEGQVDIYQAIWLEVEGLLQHTFTS